jgi:D-tyrosyl-tRNA(Tyr) deacylase
VRAVVQRVRQARVAVDGRVVGEIGPGILVLVGVSHEDGSGEARWLAEKVANLRIFADQAGKMNRSLLEVGGEALVVSQFTLYGDARRGRRPSFVHAAQGPEAEELYVEVVHSLEALGVSCATGHFGAMMDVELVNEGPVTLLLDSDKRF